MVDTIVKKIWLIIQDLGAKNLLKEAQIFGAGWSI